MDNEKDRPSAILHRAIQEAIVDAVDWDAIEKLRQPTLDYLKQSEKRDPFPMWISEGEDKGVTVTFSVAEDGEEDAAFSSETYALIDLIDGRFIEEDEARDLIIALEKTANIAKQRFEERWKTSFGL